MELRLQFKLITLGLALVLSASTSSNPIPSISTDPVPKDGVTKLTLQSTGALEDENHADDNSLTIKLYCKPEQGDGAATCFELEVDITLKEGQTHEQNMADATEAIRDAIRNYPCDSFCGLDPDKDVVRASGGATITIYGMDPEMDPCKETTEDDCHLPPGSVENQTQPYLIQRTYYSGA